MHAPMITPPPFSGDWCELLTTRVLLWRLTRRAHALHPFCALHCLCALVPCAVAPCETREREKPGGGLQARIDYLLRLVLPTPILAISLLL